MTSYLQRQLHQSIQSLFLSHTLKYVQTNDVRVAQFAKQRDLASHFLFQTLATDLVAVQNFDGDLAARDFMFCDWKKRGGLRVGTIYKHL
jgi:hypothetical protein